MKKISIAIMVLVVALTACKKDPEVNLKYVDVKRDLITVGMTTATVQCDYQYIATLKKAYFYYGEGADENDLNTAEMRVVQNTLYVDLADLKPNTLYSYYYEFHNGFNSMQTAAKTFKTEALPIALPTVITATVTEITTTSAKGGGEVTNDGGAEVTERGICWSENENPTLNDSHVAAGTGTGVFTAAMTGLEIGVTYHVRAYAVNEKGTAYGLDREFTTNSIEGALSGDFSVSETEKVRFSKGNLQYRASTNTWRFAENQWDYVGENNINASATYDGWFDLFSWGTSGYNHGAVCYEPWSTGGQFDHAAYNHNDYDLCDETGQADWGYNAISNGSYQEGCWRTLRTPEWQYLLEVRSTNSGMRYVKAEVNGINGLILLPDDWDPGVYVLSHSNEAYSAFDENTISLEAWTNILEGNGAVFLPAAGNIQAWSYENFDLRGVYWSSSSHAPWLKGLIDFTNDGLGSNASYYPHCRYSVRLVHSSQNTSMITVDLNPIGGGTISGQGIQINGQICTLTAAPSSGYVFLYWKEHGKVISASNPFSFAVGFNRNIEACFDEEACFPLIYSYDENSYTACVTGHVDGINAAGDIIIPNAISHLENDYMVTTIGSCAFMESKIASVFIPNSITVISYGAFAGCSSITSFDIPNSVVEIGSMAFNGTGIESITIPESVTSLGSQVFYGCSNLISVTLPSRITSLGYGLFQYCRVLQTITIPNSVTFIDKYAFLDCIGLSSINLSSIVPPVLDLQAFENVNKSIPVYIPSGSLSTYQNAEGWSEFTNFIEY